MPMTKGKLSLLLLSVAIVALLLSGCFLPPKPADNTGPTISISPQTVSAEAGQPFTVQVSASDPSGVEYVQATFLGKTLKVQSSSASFTFNAPNVMQVTQYQLEVKAVDNSKNHNVTTKDYTVAVWPTESGTLTTSVQLNNANGIYVYPVGPQQNGAVLISVKVLKGANLVKSVNVFVDGKSIPSTSTASAMKAAAAATSTEAEWTFFYPINAQTAGPHTYYAVFYGQSGNPIQKSGSGWFYITYPSKQNVELSAATPIHNGSYLTGDVSFTATATDYTSNYEAFLIKGTTASTKVFFDYPSTNILNVESATKIVEKSYDLPVDTTKLKDGSYTFEFIDKSIDGTTKLDSKSYIIDNTAPTLEVSYKGIPSVGNTLYVGASPVTFDVYAYDTNWMSAEATLGNQPVTLIKNATTTVDVSGLTNEATEAFSATVKDYADHQTSVSLTIVRDTVPPTIHSATISGLATYNGVPYSVENSGTITVIASVTDKNLKSVAFVLSINSPQYVFPMTKNASGLWEGTFNLSGILPGTYQGSVVATDLALNSTTFVTDPATVNVYRTLSGVFNTSLETTPSTPVNGFVKSATITVNVNPDWVYAVKKIYLYNGTTVANTLNGAATTTYYFPITTGTGTYHVIVEDNVAATYTDNESYVVNIDNTAPTFSSVSGKEATVTTHSYSFTINATDSQSGVSEVELMYQTLGATGADNGGWITADSTSGNMLGSVTLTWNNINTLPDGKYNIKIVAIDGVGNENATTTYIYNDNSGKPTVEFTMPPEWTNSTETVVTIGATVKNESDVTITATSGSATLIDFGTPTVTSDSYTAYPFTATWKATFTGSNATSMAEVKVVDEAGNTVTATKVIGFDNAKPTVYTQPVQEVPTISVPATVEGGSTFSITIGATDNLSAIKSVTIGGEAATLTTANSTNEFGVLNGTYSATFVATTTSGYATYDIVVYDNAGNEATAAVTIYVDASAPTIAVKFAGTGVTPSITINPGATYTVYAKSAATVTITATDDSGEDVTLKATIGSWTSNDTAVTAEVSSPLSAGTYAITAIATDEYGHTATFDTATVTVVIDNTAPTATLDVPPVLSLANFDTAVATYTATDANFYEATLTINGKSISVAQASPATVSLDSTAFGLNTVNGATVTATLTVVDKAGNITTATKNFYVDTVAPTMYVNKTLYKSGGTYYLDIQFSEDMYSAAGTPANITFLSSSDVVFDVNGVYYYLDTSATLANTYTNDNGKGLLHISQLLTTSGATTNVLPLAGNTVTITLNSAKFVDKVGNKLSNSPYTVTFQNVSTPNPVNP